MVRETLKLKLQPLAVINFILNLYKMSTKIKSLGMIHIKGVNDKKYEEYKKKVESKTQNSRNNYIVSVVGNRW